MVWTRLRGSLLLLCLGLTAARPAATRNLAWQWLYGAADPTPPTNEQLIRSQMATHLCPNGLTETCAQSITMTLQQCNTLQQTFTAQQIGSTLSLPAQLNTLQTPTPAVVGWWCLAERSMIEAMEDTGPATFAAMLDKTAALSGGPLTQPMMNIAEPGACPESGAVNPFCDFGQLQPPGEEYTPGRASNGTVSGQPPLTKGVEGMEALSAKCLTVDPTKLFGGAATPNEQAAEAPSTAPGTSAEDPGAAPREQTAKPEKPEGGNQAAPPATAEDPNDYTTPNQGVGKPIEAPPVEIPLPPGSTPKPPENPNGKNKQRGEIWYTTKGGSTIGGWGGKNPDGTYGGGGGITKNVGGELGLGVYHSGSVHVGGEGVGFGHAEVGLLGTFSPTPDAETANWCRQAVATITYGCFAAKAPLIDPVASCALQNAGKQAPIMTPGMPLPTPSGPMTCGCNPGEGGDRAEGTSANAGNGGTSGDAGGTNSDCPICCNEQAPTDIPSPDGHNACDCSKCGGGNAPTRVERCAAGTLGAPLNTRLCGAIDPSPLATQPMERAITPANTESMPAGTTLPASRTSPSTR
ncbi:MAG: hypothetical protein HY696_11370 [Deltaproteobacteria bacterium]|nr:hypothetical protein [Deltaproteobacteria bacterium]